MTDKRYERLKQIWTHILTVQMTLLVVGSLLHDDRVIYASLLFGALAIGVGAVVFNECTKRIEAAKGNEEASE
jgi:hypothetical protein